MASLVGFYLLIQLLLAVPFTLILWGISRLVRKRAPALRTAVMVIAATLLLTPGWGPATITIVPIPFGVLLGISLITFRWSERISVMGYAPVWYCVAFPVTALCIYGFRRTLMLNIPRWTDPENGR